MRATGERREFLRAGINVFINENFNCDVQLARAMDICESGLCYIKPSGAFERHGPQVALEFCLPDDAQPLRARGKVVYDRLDENTHKTAVVFTHLEAGDAERIRNYVIRRKRAELFDQMRTEHLQD
jgi:c-di-GMP-binding flagellar brake protein YcgR